MKRIQPEGSEWDDFVREWNKRDHIGKVNMARLYGVSYDLAKHWISNAGEAGKGQVKEEETDDDEVLTVDDILKSTNGVNLDFVTFDLETTNLKADFSIVLAAVIKPFGRPPVVFRADEFEAWNRNRADDCEIICAVAEELSKHAIVVTHYGTGFDIPYLRAKMVKYGLQPLPPMFGVDSYSIAKQNFEVSSRRLKNLARYFDLGDKTDVEGELWMEAAYGAPKVANKALDKIVDHNIKDCELLEKLACLSFPYLKAIRRL